MSELFGRVYDTFAAEYERARVPRFRAFVKQLLRLYDTRPGSWVLDAGCGTGLAATLVAPRVGHGGKIIGIDASEAMLELARAKARNFGFDQCEFRRGDIRRLDCADSAFDVVICSFALWGDPAHLFHEFFRVLKKEGALLFQDWSGDADAVMAAYNAVASKYRVETNDAAHLALRAAFAEHTALWGSVRAVEQYAPLLRAAGFGQIHGQPCALPMQFANADELLEFINLGIQAQGELRFMDAAQRAAFNAQALQALQPFASDGKFVYEKRALQVVARK